MLGLQHIPIGVVMQAANSEPAAAGSFPGVVDFCVYNASIVIGPTALTK